MRVVSHASTLCIVAAGSPYVMAALTTLGSASASSSVTGVANAYQAFVQSDSRTSGVTISSKTGAFECNIG